MRRASKRTQKRSLRSGRSDGRAQGSARCKSSALRALTASALALPGLATADSPVEKISTDYNYSMYRESSIPSSKISGGGNGDRMEVDMHQFNMQSPLGERTDFSLDVTHEIMSGASPWFVEDDGNGNAVQVMSGATIEDTRTDALLTGNYYFEKGVGSLGAGISVEDDYFAVNGSLSGQRNYNDKNTTLSAGLGFSIDTIEPVDTAVFPTRPVQEDKNSVSAFGGISQVLDRHSTIQSTGSYRYSSGYLSDPYKLASVGGVNLQDARPDVRHQFSWLTRYRRHFSAVNATMHADYQLYVDDWSINSHTVELAWYQSLWDTIRIIPSLRYYTQSQAEFYAPFYASLPTDGYVSSDYRLSPYGALSWRLRAETEIHGWPGDLDWRASVSWERYLSGGNYAAGSVGVENPGVVDFDILSFSFTAKF